MFAFCFVWGRSSGRGKVLFCTDSAGRVVEQILSTKLHSSCISVIVFVYMSLCIIVLVIVKAIVIIIIIIITFIYLDFLYFYKSRCIYHIDHMFLSLLCCVKVFLL